MTYRFIAVSTWIRGGAGVVPGSALGRGSKVSGVTRLADAMIGGMLCAVLRGFGDERKRKREKRGS